MNVSNRIRMVRAEMSRRSFSQRINITESTLGNYEQGQSLPNVDVAARICSEFGISPEWILFGTGPMRAGEDAHFNRPISATVDAGLLRDAIEAVETFLHAHDVRVSPEVRAKVAAQLYEIELDGEAKEPKLKKIAEALNEALEKA